MGWSGSTPARGSVRDNRATRRTGAARRASEVAEGVDRVEVTGPLLLVADPQTLLRSEAEDADLALVEVVVHVERRLADLGQRVGPRQGRVDHPLGDQPVGLPGLAVVGEVGADDAL